MPMLTESAIRRHIFAAYRSGPGKSYNDVWTYVASRKNPHQLNPQEQAAFWRVMWELSVQGVVAPQGPAGGALLSTVRLTEYGRQCAKEEALLPHDVDGYLASLKACMGGTPDELVLQYAREALECYQRNNLRAAVVMLGVAAERSLNLLSTAYAECLGEEARVKAAPKLCARNLRDRFDYLWKRVEANGLPPELQDRAEGDFWGAFQLIRRSRNEAGHFTAVETDRLTALACLASFPGFVASLQRLIDHLKLTRGS